MKRTPSLSRRTLLRGGAGFSLALPFLEAMTPLGKQAQAAPAKKLLFWMQPLSIYADVFWPAAPGAKEYNYRTDPMREIAWSGPGTMDNDKYVLPEMLKALEPHRSELTFVEGLDNSGGNHPAYSTTLTGTDTYEKSPSNMISIDQVIAQKLNPSTRFKTMHAGVHNGGSNQGQAISWLSKSQAVPATDNPIKLWERVFADVSADPGQAQKLRAKKQSVLDAALSQANGLKAKLGAADKAKVDQYLTSFRELESRLGTGAQQGCNPPEKTSSISPSHGKGLYDGDELEAIEDTPFIMKQQIDLMAMAFACDLTRIGTFQFGTEANNLTFPWIGLPSWRWHDASHFEAQEGKWPEQAKYAEGWRAVAKWSLEQFGVLVQRLKDFGAFDDMMAVFLTSMNHGGAHTARSCPILIAGSGGGTLRAGRHVRLAHQYNGGGKTRRFNDLHLTLAKAMGVNLTTFGDADKSTGPITELLT